MQRSILTLRSTAIWSLVLSLIAGGPLPGFAKALQAQVGDQRAVECDQACSCCCGAQCAKRCGGKCCCQKTSAPKPVSATPPLRSNAGKLSLLMLAGATDGTVAVHTGNRANVRSYRETLGDSLAIASLQTQHVRIQT